MRKCKDFVLLRAGWMHDVPLAVFGEARIRIDGRERDLSFILTMSSPGMLELAHAVRNPKDAPNRKLARRICRDRLSRGFGYRMPVATALGAIAAGAAAGLDWLGCGGFVESSMKNADPFELGDILSRSHQFFDDPVANAHLVKPWHFAELAQAFFLKGWPAPRAMKPEDEDDDVFSQLAEDLFCCSESLLDFNRTEFAGEICRYCPDAEAWWILIMWEPGLAMRFAALATAPKWEGALTPLKPECEALTTSSATAGQDGPFLTLCAHAPAWSRLLMSFWREPNPLWQGWSQIWRNCRFPTSSVFPAWEDHAFTRK